MASVDAAIQARRGLSGVGSAIEILLLSDPLLPLCPRAFLRRGGIFLREDKTASCVGQRDWLGRSLALPFNRMDTAIFSQGAGCWCMTEPGRPVERECAATQMAVVSWAVVVDPCLGHHHHPCDAFASI